MLFNRERNLVEIHLLYSGRYSEIDPILRQKLASSFFASEVIWEKNGSISQDYRQNNRT